MTDCSPCPSASCLTSCFSLPQPQVRTWDPPQVPQGLSSRVEDGLPARQVLRFTSPRASVSLVSFSTQSHTQHTAPGHRSSKWVKRAQEAGQLVCSCTHQHLLADTYCSVFQRGKLRLREEGKAYKFTQPRKMLALPTFWGQKFDPGQAWDAGRWFMV